ncbi:helix-turn-helix domain-containing protein [Radiobacillus sp. PE A8.2]|uniref:helix-turn-helix domain-containing protein n=1 Tax=Radiobacillus sp. PE A8.2 TaxID=3380349 RepID=UPI00388E0F29
MTIGTRIRILRTDQRRTLQEIAEASGLTKSFLSKVENGKSVPAIASLMKIADVLGVKASELMDEEAHVGTVFTPHIATEKRTIKTDKGYSFLPVAVERSEKVMQPYIFTARKGEISGQKLSHAGEEFIYILEGEMTFQVGDKEYLLQVGDSLYFDSIENHELKPVSDEVRYLAVFTKTP